MQVINNVRRLAYAMLAEWRINRPLYQAMLFAVGFAYLAGVHVTLARLSANFGWRCWFAAIAVAAVAGMASFLLEVRRFVRR
jgi:hypothetical protein